MNISRILSSFALLNPFAVKVAAYGDTLVAYRNVLGMKLAVTGKREQRAIVDYVAKTVRASGIDKGRISPPLGFVDPHKGDLLNILLAPTAKPVVRAQEHTILTKPQSAKLEGKRPANQPSRYLSAVDKHVLSVAFEQLAPKSKALQVTNPSAPTHSFACKLDELD